MLKRQYLGYMIFGLGLIFLTVVLLSQTQSVNSQRNFHSTKWIKPLTVSEFCDKDCPPDVAAKVQSSVNFPSEFDFDGDLDNDSCIHCHEGSIPTDIDFLVSPQEMTNQLQARFLTVSKRVLALQPVPSSLQYQAMIESYMQIHQQQILGQAIYNPTQVGNTLQLLTTVENLVTEVEHQNHWAEISAIPFAGGTDAATLKIDKKCSFGGICQQFIYSIKPPASSPEKHVSDTPAVSTEIKWSVSRRGPPAFSTLTPITTRRLQPLNGRSSFVLASSVIIPKYGYTHRPNLVKERIIEQTVLQNACHSELLVTTSKHLEKSLR
ncbi:MAG: hypothetical protein HY862_20745 [Chloroflexi bacterium]|nr:hypothetical protein [Chloroflexota bacterium]